MVFPWFFHGFWGLGCRISRFLRLQDVRVQDVRVPGWVVRTRSLVLTQDENWAAWAGTIRGSKLIITFEWKGSFPNEFLNGYWYTFGADMGWHYQDWPEIFGLDQVLFWCLSWYRCCSNFSVWLNPDGHLDHLDQGKHQDRGLRCPFPAKMSSK
jgi:hypothetical protein